MKKSIILIFWVLIINFLFILSMFFVPAVNDLFSGTIFLLPLIIFSLLGVVLLILSIKEKGRGAFRKFLILTGASATGFFVSVFLHNAFYALNILTSQIFGLNYLTELIHVAFFLIAIFVCPLGFLAGVVGSIIFFIKNKKNSTFLLNE